MDAFITLNPQIECLQVKDCQNVTFSAYNRISNRLPNLTNLSIECMKPMTISEYNELVAHLTQLRKLEHLEIIVRHSQPAKILIDSLVANIPTIETLRLCGFDHDFEKTVPGLLKLQQLKKLACYVNDPLTQIVAVNTIVELIKELPALKEIMFNCNTISVSEIIHILEYSEHLTMVSIWIDEMDIDLSAYESILASITGRLQVVLDIIDGYVDQNILQKNDQRLEINQVEFIE